MQASTSPALGRWAYCALLVAAATVLLADTNRFLPPVAEKYVDSIAHGATDLLPSFQAAHALLEGKNPYHYVSKKLRDPELGPGVTYVYPPSHILPYVPVVWFAHWDLIKAGRLQFYASLIIAALLALAVEDLLGMILPLTSELRLALLPTLLFILVCNPGSELGLERGQSDLITAALCWWAAAWFQRGWFAGAAFLAVSASLLKGYGVLFCLGLCLLGIERGAFRKIALGVGLAVALLLLPVARYLPDALAAYPVRAAMFWSYWYNQSAFNLFYTIDPRIAPAARAVTICSTCALSLIVFWRLRRMQRAGSSAEQQTLGLVMFTTASLATMLTVSFNCLAYTAPLVLPGALLIALAQSRLFAHLGERGRQLVGGLLVLIMFGLCSFSLQRLVGRTHALRDVPVHAIALLLLLGLIGYASTRRLDTARAAGAPQLRPRARRSAM